MQYIVTPLHLPVINLLTFNCNGFGDIWQICYIDPSLERYDWQSKSLYTNKVMQL